MDKKKIQETYGLDVANVVKEGEKLGQPMDVNNAISIADQQYKEKQKQLVANPEKQEQYAQAKRIAPRSFSSHEDVMKTHQYMGEIDLGNGNYWTILKGQDGFVATSPTNTGMIFNSSYFENIEDLYEELQQQGDFLQEKKGK